MDIRILKLFDLILQRLRLFLGDGGLFGFESFEHPVACDSMRTVREDITLKQPEPKGLGMNLDFELDLDQLTEVRQIGIRDFREKILDHDFLEQW